MTYGVTSSGFNIPNFDEEKAHFESGVQNKLGAVDFEAPSVFSVLSSLNTSTLIKLWEGVQETYYASFIDTATDVSLDYVVAGMGITRLLPTYSKVMCQFTGELYTTIPAFTQFAQIYTNKLFSSNSDLVLNNNLCFGVKIVVDDISKTNFQVKIADQIITHAKAEDDDELAILTAIKIAINNVLDNLIINITDNTLIITCTELADAFSCYVQEGLKITEVTNSFELAAEEKGYVPVPAHSITQIQNAVTGLISVDNLNSGESGRELESDVELRSRAKNSTAITGNGTVLAIKAKLLQLSGVTAATVAEDLDANTISALVVGGDDDAIAKTILESKPAGITTLGLVEKVVQDIYNDNRTIRFSRPQKIFIFVKITLTTTTEFQDEYIPTIKEKISLLFKNKKIGEAVQYQAIFSPIYSVDGVTNAVVTIGGTPVETIHPTTFNAANIHLQNTQIAVTDTSKITIEVGQ